MSAKLEVTQGLVLVHSKTGTANGVRLHASTLATCIRSLMGSGRVKLQKMTAGGNLSIVVGVQLWESCLVWKLTDIAGLFAEIV